MEMRDRALCDFKRFHRWILSTAVLVQSLYPCRHIDVIVGAGADDIADCGAHVFNDQ